MELSQCWFRMLRAVGVAAVLGMAPLAFIGSAAAQPAAVAGAAPGALAINAMGQAGYRIPIAVAPGIAGMEPSLSLEYSSGGANGIAGMGWSIGGLSMIHRCPRTQVQDGGWGNVTYGARGPFCLDGKRLVAVSGDYGDDGTEYRTEIDGLFKIVSYGKVESAAGVPGASPLWFRVWSKSGWVMDYGATEGARVRARDYSDYSEVRVWAVNRIGDVSGNYMTYTYEGAEAEGPRLLSIDYTLNDSAAVGAQNQVRFIYDYGRPDKAGGYLAGHEVRVYRRLSGIRTYANGYLVRNYRLAYDQSVATSRSRLTEVQECGAGGCLPPHTFAWNDNGKKFGGTELLSSAVDIGYVAGREWVDFNGDGRTDYCRVIGNVLNVDSRVSCTLSTGSGFGATVKSGVLDWGEDTGSAWADFNGDGRADYCRVVGNILNSRVSCTLSTGSGFGATVKSGKLDRGYASGRAWVDFNGDGRADYCRRTGNLISGHRVSCTLSAGSRFGATVTSGKLDWGYGAGREWADFNGDGRADYCRVVGVQFESRVSCTLSKGTRFGVTIRSGTLDWGYGAGRKWVDFNGDGLADYCRVLGNILDVNSRIACSPSTGTGFRQTVESDVLDWGYNDGRTWIDFNGDGRADYCRLVGLIDGQDSRVSCTLSTSFGGFGETTTSPVIPWGIDGSRAWVDVNGDGLPDFCSNYGRMSGPLTMLFCIVDENGEFDVISEITDSLGTTTRLAYAPMTDDSVYEKHSDAVYPIQDVQLPLYVVSEVARDDGVGGQAIMRYGYAGAKLDLTGRGFLGFRFTDVTDVQTGTMATTRYAQNFPFTGQVEAVETYIPDSTGLTAGTTLGRTTNSLDSLSLNAGATVIPYVLESVTESYEFSHGNDNQPTTRATETSVYDDYGNPTQVRQTTVGGGRTFTTVTNSTYVNDPVTWRLGQMIRSEVTRTTLLEDSTSRSQTRVSSMAYDPLTSLLSREVVEPDSATSAQVTDYERDIFGHIVETTVSGPDIESRTTTMEYAAAAPNYGRFATRVTNALGHVETRTYDARFGAVTSISGPNNITTGWAYDGFGRKTLESRADGTETRWSYDLCTTQCPAGGIYAVTRQNFASSTATTPYDAKRTEYSDTLNRVFRIETQGFDGTAVYTDMLFNARGEVEKASRPYFAETAAPDIQWTVTAYDTVGRVKSVTAPGGGVTKTDYDGLGATGTNALNQTETRINDALGQLVAVVDDAGAAIVYSYDPFGNLEQIDTDGAVTTMTYDIRGRMTFMDDPDMGALIYDYNTLGEVVNRTDAKGQVVTMTYDLLGRMKTRTEAEGTTTWEYDNTLKLAGIGKLDQVSRTQDNYVLESFYDALGRPRDTELSYEGRTSVLSTTYDAVGREATLTYPAASDGSRFAAENHYNTYGYLDSVRQPGAAGAIYWRAVSMDAGGKVTEERLGNGLVTLREYDPTTGRVQSIGTYSGSDAVRDLGYRFDALGNLLSRVDRFQNREESFAYDNLNRLDTATVIDTLTQTQLGQTTMAYDASGNIVFKSDIGLYGYDSVDSGPHAVSRAGNVIYNYDINGSMISSVDATSGLTLRTVTWSSFNKPVRIQANTRITAGLAAKPATLPAPARNNRRTAGKPAVAAAVQEPVGAMTIDFVYGPDRARIKQTIYRNVQSAKTITYVGGAFERHAVAGVGADEMVHYIRAGGVVAIFKKIDDGIAATDRTLYPHGDHLGSIDTITDEGGFVVERRSYDAFGRPRNADWTAALADVSLSETKRGFTGHEHLDAVGLIHMNGRVYDPVIGRFLSADPFVQFPDLTQSYNRYSYVLNNPLSFTDPSGFGIFRDSGTFMQYALTVVGVGFSLAGMPWVGVLVSSLWNLATGSTLSEILVGAGVGIAAGLAVGPVAGTLSDAVGLAPRHLGTAVIRGALGGAVSGGMTAASRGRYVWKGIGEGAFVGAATSSVVWGYRAVRTEQFIENNVLCWPGNCTERQLAAMRDAGQSPIGQKLIGGFISSGTRLLVFPTSHDTSYTGLPGRPHVPYLGANAVYFDGAWGGTAGGEVFIHELGHTGGGFSYLDPKNVSYTDNPYRSWMGMPRRSHYDVGKPAPPRPLIDEILTPWR